MAEQRELKVVLTSDTKQAEQGLNTFGGSLKRIGEIAAGIGIERIAESILRFGKEFVASSINSYAESEKTLSQLDAVIKSTKGVAQVSAESAIALSKSLQSTTTYSDEAVLSTENLLLTFTKIGKQVFPEATSAVLDMSTALGQDTKNSAIQLGKALQDPILGVTALRRVGVAFDDDQKNLIQTLVKSGKTLEAQKLILKEINTEFGGSAAAAADNYAGRLKQLKNVFDDLKEIIGKTIVNAINPFVKAFGPIISQITLVMEGTKSWGQAIDKIKTTFPELGKVIDSVIKIIKPFVDQLTKAWRDNRDMVMKMFSDILEATKEVWPLISSLIQSVLLVISSSITLALSLIKFVWETWGADLLLIAKGFLEMIFYTWKFWLDLITGIFKVFSALFKGDWAGVWTAVKETFFKIVDDIKGYLQGFFDWARGIINSLLDGLKKIGIGARNKGGTDNVSTQAAALGGYKSGMTLVGEQGPELVNLPNGSYVNTAQQTAGMLGGGATVNIYNPSVRSDNDIKELVAQVKRALGRENELARFGLI